MSHGDAYQSYFILKHYMDVVFSGNWQDLTTLPMLYGFKDSLFLNEHYLFHAFMVLPLYLLTKNIIFSVNLMTVLIIVFNFLAMYVFSFYLTKRVLPAVLAGTIFTLGPYVFARFPDHLLLITLFWIPLIFLFFEKSLKDPNGKNSFLFFLMLTGQSLSSIYYSVFLTVILPIYIIIRFVQTKVSVRRFLNWGTFIGAAILILVVAVTALAYYPTLSSDKIDRSPDAKVNFSAHLTDWLFMPPNNLVYGGVKEHIAQIIPLWVDVGIASEHNLFVGLVPISILIASFWILRKSSNRRRYWLFLGLLFLSFLLSLGWEIYVNNNIRIPGPYILFNFVDPLLTYTRVTARFAVFVVFFLALIVGLTFAHFPEKVTPKKVLVIQIFVLGLMVIEYWNQPLRFYQIP